MQLLYLKNDQKKMIDINLIFVYHYWLNRWYKKMWKDQAWIVETATPLLYLTYMKYAEDTVYCDLVWGLQQPCAGRKWCGRYQPPAPPQTNCDIINTLLNLNSLNHFQFPHINKCLIYPIFSHYERLSSILIGLWWDHIHNPKKMRFTRKPKTNRPTY